MQSAEEPCVRFAELGMSVALLIPRECLSDLAGDPFAVSLGNVRTRTGTAWPESEFSN
jgi:hypothetical protein